MLKKNLKSISAAMLLGMLTVIILGCVLLGVDNIVNRVSANPRLALVLLLFAIVAAVMIIVISTKALTDSVSKTINEIDLDNPFLYLDNSDFKEIEPLLQKMTTQQLDIQSDKTEIEKTSLIRQEFTTNVSHELKTPLHSISGYAEILENGLVKDEDISNFAGKIRVECNRLTQLVEDIIELSK